MAGKETREAWNFGIFEKIASWFKKWENQTSRAINPITFEEALEFLWGNGTPLREEEVPIVKSQAAFASITSQGFNHSLHYFHELNHYLTDTDLAELEYRVQKKMEFNPDADLLLIILSSYQIAIDQVKKERRANSNTENDMVIS